MPDLVNRRSIGASVFGPIVADALMRCESRFHAVADDESVVLFCARGGLVLQDLLERIRRRMILQPSNLPTRPLMVSRIAAARCALIQNPQAVACIIESELSDRTCSEGALAFSGPKERKWLNESRIAAGDGWDQPFKVDRFLSLLSRDAVGRRIRDGIEHQSKLLDKHLQRQAGGAARIVLCDTGVFGSTVQYLSATYSSHFEWRCILLVRANYKRLACPHFGFTEGIICERDIYDPMCPESAMLFYWQCVEAMLEPDLPSVEWFFQEPDGQVVSNLESECNQMGDWRKCLNPTANLLLAGVVDYIEALTPDDLNGIRRKAETAFQVFQKMVVRPSHQDVEMLAVGTRPLGFGSREVATFSSTALKSGGLLKRIRRVQESMWPEGELRRQFPIIATPLLALAEWRRYAHSLFPNTRAGKSTCD